MVVAAAGQLDHDRVVEAIAAGLAGRTGGSPSSRQAPSTPALPRAVVSRPTEQTHLAVATPAPDRDDEDRHAMSIVEHVLGGGMSSRLFQTIREERGLAYSVYAYRLAFQGAGALAVYAGTAPGHTSEVLDLIHAELDTVAADGLTAAELDNARGHIRGSMALGLEDTGARMSRIGHSQLVHGRVLTLDEVEARLAGLTLDHVNEVAARWLSGPQHGGVRRPLRVRTALRSTQCESGFSAPPGGWARPCAPRSQRRATWSWWPPSIPDGVGQQPAAGGVLDRRAGSTPCAAGAAGGRRLHGARRRHGQRPVVRRRTASMR